MEKLKKEKRQRLLRRGLSLLLATTSTVSMFVLSATSNLNKSDNFLKGENIGIVIAEAADKNEVEVKDHMYLKKMTYVYKKADTDSKKLSDKLDFNQKIYVKKYDKKTGWACVKYNGEYGYLKYSALQKKALYNLSELEKGGDYKYGNIYKGKLKSSEIDTLAKIVWYEAGSVKSKRQKACVIWATLNYCDYEKCNVETLLKRHPGYIDGFKPSTIPVKSDVKDLVKDVVARWYREHDGEKAVGRVLPRNYYCWVQSKTEKGGNDFRNAYKGKTIWNYDLLPNPYSS